MQDTARLLAQRLRETAKTEYLDYHDVVRRIATETKVQIYTQLADFLEEIAKTSSDQVLVYRGSGSDLATDVGLLLSPKEAKRFFDTFKLLPSLGGST